MKVTIIGKGSGWEDAPYNGECWGITQLILRRPVTRVVDMNNYSLWGAIEEEEAQLARQKALDTGVKYVDLTNYPLSSIIEYFDTDFFSNTVDYAIALALYEGCTELCMYGVNMASPGEYAYQQSGVNFWCGMAMGLGVKVKVFGEISTIMRTKDGLLYGYSSPQIRR